MLRLSDIILKQHHLLDEILKYKPLHIYIRIFGIKLLREDDVIKYYTIIKKYISRPIIERAIEYYYRDCYFYIDDDDYTHQIHWGNVSCCRNLSEDFIRDFQDRVCWNNISRYQKLTESFIREVKKKVCWYNISQYQKLSQTFIKEFQNDLDCLAVARYQILSESVIREYKNFHIVYHYKHNCIRSFSRYRSNFCLDLDYFSYLCESKHPIEEEKIEKAFWYLVSRYQVLSEDFIAEHRDKVNWE